MAIQDSPEHAGGRQPIAPPRKRWRMQPKRLLWPSFLPLILLSGLLVNWVALIPVAFAAPPAGTSAPGHLTFQQFLQEGQRSKTSHRPFVFPKPKNPPKGGNVTSLKPSAEPPTMQPLTSTLSANALSPQAVRLGVKPLDLKSSDGRLEIQVPGGAFDLSHAKTAKGRAFVLSATTTVTLRITETVGYLPGELPALGTYQVQVLDTQGNALQQVALRAPLTYIYHYKRADLAALNVNPDHVFLAWPQLVTKVQAAKQSTSTLIIPFKNDPKASTLTAQSQVVDTTSPMVAVGSSSQQRPPVPLQASVEGNTGNFGLTYPLQTAPSDFAPTLQLTYSSAAPNGRDDPRAPADDAGDGWQISMGAITATVENGTTWYFLNGVDNVSDRLIPLPGQAGFFETEHLSHLRIQQTGSTFTVWDTSGNQFIFGGTADSTQATTSGTYRWDLNKEILATEGPNTVQRQILVSYLQDVSGGNVRDSAIKQIQYGLLSADGKTFTTQGTVDFSYLAPFNLGGTSGVTFATQYNYGVNYSCTQGSPPVTPTFRCDDPMPLGQIPPPTTMSTMELQSITSYIGDDGSSSRMDHQYTFTYLDTPISTCVDAYTQLSLYCAGDHLLSSITPSDSLLGTIHRQHPVNFQYTPEQNQYFDSGNKNLNGTAQYQVMTNWSYLTKYDDTATGIGELLTYGTAQNNTHGTPTVTDSQGNILDNQLDPFYCANQQNNPDVTKRCTGSFANPDDKAWSQQVVTFRQALGKDSSSSAIQLAGTTYRYQLSQISGEAGVGDNWIPANDTNWLNFFYDGVFKGFAVVNTISPAGDLTIAYYYATEGWSTPATDLINYASGALTEEDVYRGGNSPGPVLEQTLNSYGGASGSNTVTSCDTRVTGTFIPCEPVLLSSQQTLIEGDGTWGADTSKIDLYTYDDYNPTASGTGLITGVGHYHNMTQDQLQERYGGCWAPCSPIPYAMSTLRTEKWTYATNDQTVNGWTYYNVDKVSASEVDDPAGGRMQCQTTKYDEGVASGVPTPAEGLPTTVSTYSSANCASQTSPLTTSSTGYDSNSNPVATIDGVAAANSGFYASNGCQLTVKPVILPQAWSQTRYTSCTTYDGSGVQPTQSTNVLGQTTTTTYDNTQQSLPVSTIDSNGQTTSLAYSYDNAGNMTIQISLPLESGSYTTQSTRFSNCTATSNLPCDEEDSNASLYPGAISRTFYDALGRSVETRTPGPTPGDDTLVMTVYNDAAHSVWQSVPFQVAHGSGWVDPNGAKDINGVAPAGTVTFKDALGRTIAVQDPNYGSSQEPGIACSATLSGTYTSCVNYTVGYRADTEPFVVDTSGHLGTFTKQSPRDTATSVDPNGHVTVTYSDAAGRTIFADVDSGVYGGTLTIAKETQTQYTILDKPVSIVVSDQQLPSGDSLASVTTSMTYDDLGRLLTENDPDQGNLSFTYDPDGRTLSTTQTSGSSSRTLGINYDLLGRVGCVSPTTPTVNATGGCSGAPLVQNTYDKTVLGTQGSTDFPIGQLTQSVASTYYPDSTTATVTEQFQHDQRGRQVNEMMQLELPSSWNASVAAYQLAFVYNDANQLTTTSTASGNWGYAFTNVYDPTNGVLQGVSNNKGNTANLATLTYNEYAQVAGLTLLNGASASPASLASEQFSYDGNLRPTSLAATWLPGSNNTGQILSQGRTYDNASNVTSVGTTFASVPGQSGSGGAETQNFCYDAQNRLVWSGNQGTQPGAGTGTCGSGTLASGLQGAGYTAPYVYTNYSQTWQGPVNGQGATAQYLYCGSPHQLSGIYPMGTSCSNLSGALYTAGYDAYGNQNYRLYNGVTDTLSYDALNHLTNWNASNGAQEAYVYDASGQRVFKRSTSAGTTSLTTYAFGLEEYDYGSMGGSPTNQWHFYSLAGHLIGSTNDATTTYDLTDAQGSVLMSLSASAIQGEQLYGPYGNQRYTAGTIGTDKGYTGQFHDALTGLDYYNARFYDPVSGQFLSPDSVQGNAQGMDPYVYVGDNPETNVDPTGNRITCGAGDGCGGSGPPNQNDCNADPTLAGCPGHQPPPTTKDCRGGCKAKTGPGGGCGSGMFQSNDGRCLYDSGECANLSVIGCNAHKHHEKQKRQKEQEAAAHFQGDVNWYNGLPMWWDFIGLFFGFKEGANQAAGVAQLYEQEFAAFAQGKLAPDQSGTQNDFRQQATLLVARDVFMDLGFAVASVVLGELLSVVGGIVGSALEITPAIAQKAASAVTNFLGLAAPVGAVGTAVFLLIFSSQLDDQYGGYMGQIQQISSDEVQDYSL